MSLTKKRSLLFSVTASDCVFQATKGSGPGGQHRNKVSTAIRCTHRLSGAMGYSAEDKSQLRNKRKAFGRMARSDKFQKWVRLEAAKQTGELAAVEAKVDREMKAVRVEVHDDQGRWVAQEENDD